MANADVSLEIRQKLTGHASQDMNKQYTHLELETVRRAVESISRLPARRIPACRPISSKRDSYPFG
jgi:hypothetical protein